MTAKGRGTLSIVIAFFLLASMLFSWNTLLVGGAAIIALIILAAFEFRAPPTHRS